MASGRGLALRTPTLSMAGDSNTAGEPIRTGVLHGVRPWSGVANTHLVNGRGF